MRSRLVTAIVLGGAGCSLFVDTGGFDEPASVDGGGATDAPVSSVDSGGGGEDAPVVVIDAGTDASIDAAEDVVTIIGDWPFDEGSGTTIADKSGRAHNGLAFGGVWIADHAGVEGNALHFDGGSSSYVSIAPDPDFDRPTGARFSMALWARVDGAPDHHIIFSVQYGNKDAAYGIELQGPTVLNYWDTQNHAAQTTVPNVVGAWHHYGIAVDGSAARLYFDGVRVGQTTTADTTPRTATQVLLGHSTFGQFLHGAVDKARYFRVALTDAEMMAEKNR